MLKEMADEDVALTARLATTISGTHFLMLKFFILFSLPIFFVVFVPFTIRS
jgi:hypothetical protein